MAKQFLACLLVKTHHVIVHCFWLSLRAALFAIIPKSLIIPALAALEQVTAIPKRLIKL